MEVCLLRFQRERGTAENQARGHWSDILAEDLAYFCSWPENLPEAQFKSYRGIYLVEEVLTQGSLQSVACYFLLFLFISRERKREDERKERREREERWRDYQRFSPILCSLRLQCRG